jgi:hypothetical protein
LVAIAGFAGSVGIEHPFLFEQGSEGAVHLLVDPGGAVVVIGLFKGAARTIARLARNKKPEWQDAGQGWFPAWRRSCSCRVGLASGG